MRLHRHLKSGVLLSGGSIASALCSFGRNIIIARLISVENFGIAATLAMTMSLIEMASNLSLDRLIVQAPDGDAPRLQATAQAFQALRGFFGAVVLFALAGPAAALFDIPDVRWAFQTLALVPLLRGFVHLDFARAQREMAFATSVWIDLGPQLVVTAIAAPLALWLNDYRVMLWTVLLQVSLYVLLSHLLATRRYQWAWDTHALRRMIRFGWPLLVNSLLLFGIFQGDRAIVGASFSMETLGWFSAAFMLTLTPSQVLARICQSFLMPILARVQLDPEPFLDRAHLTVQACLMIGIVVAVGFWIAGPALLLTFFGERYLDAVTVIGLLGLMQGVRLAKAGPAIVAMSRGETLTPMLANLVRMLGLLLALGAALAKFDVRVIVLCGLLGESAAMIASLALLESRSKLPIGGMMRSTALAALLVAAIAAPTYGLFLGQSRWFELVLGTAAAAVAAGVFALLSPHLRTALLTATKSPRHHTPTPHPGVPSPVDSSQGVP